MQKTTSILLGLMLIASFSLTGCQLATETKANMIDVVSSAVELNSAKIEENISADNNENANEIETISSTATETNVSKTGNEVEVRQSEQNTDDLKITAEGVPVEVRLADNGQYSYEYDKEEYAVETAANDSTFEISVTDIRPEIDSGTNVVVYVPNQSYTLITGIFEGSSLMLPEINADITITSNASSVVLSLPSDYNKTLNFTGNASSCSLSMNNINDFAVNAKISTSAVSVPKSWPVYDMLSPNYNYTGGNGTAKINIDVTSSSFIFE